MYICTIAIKISAKNSFLGEQIYFRRFYSQFFYVIASHISVAIQVCEEGNKYYLFFRGGGAGEWGHGLFSHIIETEKTSFKNVAAARDSHLNAARKIKYVTSHRSAATDTVS